jgi:hypothetical protein
VLVEDVRLIIEAIRLLYRPRECHYRGLEISFGGREYALRTQAYTPPHPGHKPLVILEILWTLFHMVLH